MLVYLNLFIVVEFESNSLYHGTWSSTFCHKVSLTTTTTMITTSLCHGTWFSTSCHRVSVVEMSQRESGRKNRQAWRPWEQRVIFIHTQIICFHFLPPRGNINSKESARTNWQASTLQGEHSIFIRIALWTWIINTKTTFRIVTYKYFPDKSSNIVSSIVCGKYLIGRLKELNVASEWERRTRYRQMGDDPSLLLNFFSFQVNFHMLSSYSFYWCVIIPATCVKGKHIHVPLLPFNAKVKFHICLFMIWQTDSQPKTAFQMFDWLITN